MGDLRNKIPIIFMHKVLLQSTCCEKRLKVTDNISIGFPRLQCLLFVFSQ